MYARAVDDAATQLRELRHEEWNKLALGALALALALVATQFRPVLALPLFVGGVFVVAGGVRAVWRHWDLLYRLAANREAYVIAEVRAHAAREATMTRRIDHAATIRGLLRRPGPDLDPWLLAAAADLEALASELENAELVLDAASAVACTRLLNDPDESPVFNPLAPPEELRTCVRRIRSGFERRRGNANEGRR